MNLFVRSALLASLALLAWFALAGCKPSPTPKVGQASPSSEQVSPTPGHGSAWGPSAEDLAAFLRAAAPAWERVADVRMEPPAPLPGAPPAHPAWLLNVRFAIVPAEDLLAPATGPQARAFQAALDELAALARWAEAYRRSPYAGVYPAFDAEVSPPGFPPLLCVAQPRGRPLAPVSGKMAADWQADHWNFGALDLSLPETGLPRAQFDSSALVLGSPEAEALLAEVKAALAQAQPQQATIEAAYRADLLKATQPGALYRGQLVHRARTVAAEVRFTAPPAGVDPQRNAGLEVRLPATPDKAFLYLARRAGRLPLQLAAPADAEAGTPAPQGTEPPPRGDLTLSLARASGKEGAFDGSIPVEMLSIIHSGQQPSVVVLNIRDGLLEGRINGYSHDTAGFVLSARQSP